MESAINCGCVQTSQSRWRLCCCPAGSSSSRPAGSVKLNRCYSLPPDQSYPHKSNGKEWKGIIHLAPWKPWEFFDAGKENLHAAWCWKGCFSGAAVIDLSSFCHVFGSSCVTICRLRWRSTDHSMILAGSEQNRSHPSCFDTQPRAKRREPKVSIDHPQQSSEERGMLPVLGPSPNHRSSRNHRRQGGGAGGTYCGREFDMEPNKGHVHQ